MWHGERPCVDLLELSTSASPIPVQSAENFEIEETYIRDIPQAIAVGGGAVKGDSGGLYDIVNSDQ